MTGSSYQLEAQLRTLPDEALAQVAQANQDNALVMAAVLNEKSRRDRMRGGVAGMQAAAQMDQPTVRDQLLSGLAAAPDSQPATLAEGGIVAFSQGGTTPDKPTKDSINARLLQIDGELRKFRAGVTRKRTPAELQAEAQRVKELTEERRRLQFQLNKINDPSANGASASWGSSVSEAAGAAAGEAAGVAAGAAAAKSPAAKASAAKSPAAQPAAPTTPGASWVDAFYNPYLNAAKERDAAARLAFAQSVDTSTPYAKLQSMYDAQEKQNAAAKQQGLYEALLTAGLGMAGGKSPFALQNIAEGGAEGLAAYKTTTKDLRELEQQRQMGLAQIEEARRQQGVANQQRAFEFESGLRSAADTREAQGVALNVNAEQQARQLAAAERAARIRSSAYGGVGSGALLKEYNALVGYRAKLATQLRGLPPYGTDNQTKRDALEQQIAEIDAKLTALAANPYFVSSGVSATDEPDAIDFTSINAIPSGKK